MNTTTKQWLLDLLDEEERRQRKHIADSSFLDRRLVTANVCSVIESARRLVEQGPEEPSR